MSAILSTMIQSALIFTLLALSVSFKSGRAALPGVQFSCVVPKTAAITFDDGPWHYSTIISDTLAAAGAKGTFFVNGKNVGCIYDDASVASLKHAYALGHQVASHTWSHPDLTTLTEAQTNTELDRVEVALKNILGVVPALVRPPFGSYNDLIVQIAANRNLTLVNWNLDSRDWAGIPADESIGIYEQFAATNPSTLISLNHESYQTSATVVLPYVIDLLQSNGYTLVTAAECLGLEPYSSIEDPKPKDDTWTC